MLFRSVCPAQNTYPANTAGRNGSRVCLFPLRNNKILIATSDISKDAMQTTIRHLRAPNTRPIAVITIPSPFPICSFDVIEIPITQSPIVRPPIVFKILRSVIKGTVAKHTKNKIESRRLLRSGALFFYETGIWIVAQENICEK